MTTNEWTTYRTRFLIRAKQLNSNLAFTDALGRQHCGRRGDYLVESYEGVLSIAPRQIFEDIYVPMSVADDLVEARATTTPFSIPDLSRSDFETFAANAVATSNFPRRRRTDRPQLSGARRKSPQPVRTTRVSSLGLV